MQDAQDMGSAYRLAASLEYYFGALLGIDVCSCYFVAYVKFVGGSCFGPRELFFCIPPTKIHSQRPQNAGFVDNSKPECTKELELPFQLFTWRLTARDEKYLGWMSIT